MDRKGPSAAVVKWLSDKLEQIGYSGVDITLKSDQALAVVDV